jgi:hypothetical protein
MWSRGEKKKGSCGFVTCEGTEESSIQGNNRAETQKGGQVKYP